MPSLSRLRDASNPEYSALFKEYQNSATKAGPVIPVILVILIVLIVLDFLGVLGLSGR